MRFPPCVEILYKRGLQSAPPDKPHLKQIVTSMPGVVQTLDGTAEKLVRLSAAKGRPAT